MSKHPWLERKADLKHHGGRVDDPQSFGTQPSERPTMGMDHTGFLAKSLVLRGLVGTSLSLGWVTAWCSRPLMACQIQFMYQIYHIWPMCFLFISVPIFMFV